MGAETIRPAIPASTPAGSPSANRLSAGAERLITPVASCTSSSTSVTGKAMATAVANICAANPPICANWPAPNQL